MILRHAAIAALLAAPLSFSPALAQEMMHPEMNVTCSVSDMGEMGMTIMFHNMGAEAIPAGSKAHWKVRGVAQGDVSFMDAVAPDGMKEQMYMGQEMMHGSSSAPCTVDMM